MITPTTLNKYWKNAILKPKTKTFTDIISVEANGKVALYFNFIERLSSRKLQNSNRIQVQKFKGKYLGQTKVNLEIYHTLKCVIGFFVHEVGLVHHCGGDRRMAVKLLQ